MVQSLAQREYLPQLYNSVGILVTDECHRVSAPLWSTVVPKFPARYRWGLSATPERQDKLDRIFQYHCGPVAFQMLGDTTRTKVYQLHTGTELSQRAWTNPWNGQPNFSRAYSSLSIVETRNQFIAREVAKAFQAGRKTLVLSKRVTHLHRLQEASLKLDVPAEKIGIITGEVPAEFRTRILEQCRVIFAIESIAGLGMDQPDLDTLIYALPTQAVEQTIGRIEREYPGKKRPLVIDLVDDVSLFQRLAKSRLKKYRELGYEVARSS
jgi:superfamily II DNA or RNA helicase